MPEMHGVCTLRFLGGFLGWSGNKFNGCGIDAISCPLRILGCVVLIVKQMPKMRPAAGADNLHAIHAERIVMQEFDLVAGLGSVERGPAAAGVELGIRGEKLLSAGGAGVRAGLEKIIVFVFERPVRGFLPQDRVFLGSE